MVFYSTIFQCCSFSGFWSRDPNVLLVGKGTDPLYALLSSGFVWMLLSLCTLISIVSGLRDSFPFSSFSGSFLRWKQRKEKKHRHFETSLLDNYRNSKHTYNKCEQTQTREWPPGGCVCMKQAQTLNASEIRTELLPWECVGLMIFSTNCALLALEPTSNHLLDVLVHEWVDPIGTNKAEFNWSEKAAGILNIKASHRRKKQIIHIYASLWPKYFDTTSIHVGWARSYL